MLNHEQEQRFVKARREAILAEYKEAAAETTCNGETSMY